MKRLFSKATLLAFAAAFSLASCLSDGDDTIVLEDGMANEGKDLTQVVSSSESAIFVRQGFEITVPYGAVPKTSSGNDGRVAFSVTANDELPTNLPDNMEMVNGASIKIEPMNFTFNSPITINIPTFGYDPEDLALLHYNEYTGQWEIIPFSSINSDGTVSVSVIELGYFVLVVYTDDMSNGGIHIDNRYLEEGYYYYLTLTPNSGSTTGATKRISFAANGHDLYMGNVPLGTYNVTVTRELRDDLGSASSNMQYTQSQVVYVRDRLIPGSGNYSTYDGWTEVMLSGRNWTNGRPDVVWGDATETYGTGTFQATLTWVNTSSSTTDYDLHLYGPDNIHVWYSNKNSGAFELDRDWTTPVGNAVENIYTINDNVTPGEYTVKVHHFSGVLGKRYNCRVIIDGVVVKSVTGSISTNKVYDDIYSFTVE